MKKIALVLIMLIGLVGSAFAVPVTSEKIEYLEGFYYEVHTDTDAMNNPLECSLADAINLVRDTYNTTVEIINIKDSGLKDWSKFTLFAVQYYYEDGTPFSSYYIYVTYGEFFLIATVGHN